MELSLRTNDNWSYEIIDDVEVITFDGKGGFKKVGDEEFFYFSEGVSDEEKLIIQNKANMLRHDVRQLMEKLDGY